MKMNRSELEKKVNKLIGKISYEKGYVSMVDLLMGLGYLSDENYNKWRTGKVDYLERICSTNLSKLSFVHSTLKKYAFKYKMKPSKTVYNKWGKGKKELLRFSKSGKRNIEDSYATHYVRASKINNKKREKGNAENERENHKNTKGTQKQEN